MKFSSGLLSASPNVANTLLSLQSVIISTDLYGSETFSYFYLAKGFTKQIEQDATPKSIKLDLISARDALLAKRKLRLIFSTKENFDPVASPGDLVEVLVKKGQEKRCK